MWDVSSSPVGRPTRGTTGVNRLRRVDRWIARHPVLRRAEDPLVVDGTYAVPGVQTEEAYLQVLDRLAGGTPDGIG